MSRITSFALGFTTAALIASFLIAKQRSEIRDLMMQSAQPPQTPQEQPEEVKPPQIEAQPRQTADSDQSLEVLRLRGEISQLRRDLDEAGAKKPRLIYGPSPAERWSLSYLSYAKEIGADLNHIPDLINNKTRTQATNELARVGARILADETGFIHAEVHLPTLNNGGVITDYFTIYFDPDGKLNSLNTNQRLAGYDYNK